MIAALYVERGGVYWDLPGVDPWDEERDARLYDGPHPVVAHPPCNRWCVPLAQINETRYGHRVGDDGGCFEAALDAVRRFGGVLEHPAYTVAWERYRLPRPVRGGWSSSLEDPGWVTEVSQSAYGHPARKRTWLYYVGDAPPPSMDWRNPQGTAAVSWLGESDLPVMKRGEAKLTPIAFRDVLIGMARSAQASTEVA